MKAGIGDKKNDKIQLGRELPEYARERTGNKKRDSETVRTHNKVWLKARVHKSV